MRITRKFREADEQEMKTYMETLVNSGEFGKVGYHDEVDGGENPSLTDEDGLIEAFLEEYFPGKDIHDLGDSEDLIYSLLFEAIKKSWAASQKAGHRRDSLDAKESKNYKGSVEQIKRDYLSGKIAAGVAAIRLAATGKASTGAAKSIVQSWEEDGEYYAENTRTRSSPRRRGFREASKLEMKTYMETLVNSGEFGKVGYHDEVDGGENPSLTDEDGLIEAFLEKYFPGTDSVYDLEGDSEDLVYSLLFSAIKKNWATSKKAIRQQDNFDTENAKNYKGSASQIKKDYLSGKLALGVAALRLVAIGKAPDAKTARSMVRDWEDDSEYYA
jgi:hypothetical protein